MLPRERATIIGAVLPPLLGRSALLATLREELASEPGLWTLTGPPGMGKTRLAKELDGVFCDLSEARDLDALVEGVAAALALPLREVARDARIAHLAAAVGPDAPLILDNLEQCVDAARALVEGLLEQTPEARIVATSRTVLGAAGERVVELPPLDTAAGGPAYELFVDRVRRLRRDYDAGEEHDAIERIVASLDGLPLAIELAAARARLMSARSLAERLDAPLQVLGGTRRRTLRGAIEESWALLSPHERRAFAQCAVFAGPFDLDAAEAVIALDPGAPEPLEVLQSLRDRSLISTVERGDDLRLVLLSSLRAFAREQLDAGGERADAEARHAAVTLARTRAAAEELDVGRAASRAAIVAEREQLHAIADRGGEAGLEALIVLAALIETDGVSERHHRALEAALAAADDAVPPVLRARGWLELSTVCRAAGDLDASLAHARRASEIAEARGDHALAGRALRRIGMLAIDAGDLSQAARCLEEACARQREAGHRTRLGIALSSLGRARYAAGDAEEAERVCREALAIHREQGTELWEGVTRGYLAYLAMDAGRFDDARAHLEDCVALFERLGSDAYLGAFAGALASLHHARGELERAEPLFERALTAMEAAGRRRLAGIHAGNLGVVALEREAAELAARRLRDAVERLDAVGDRTSAAFFEAYLAGAAARGGLTAEARHHLARARERIADGANPSTDQVVSVMAAVVELAETADVEACRARLAQSSRAEPSADVRIALRVAEAMVGKAQASGRLGPADALARVARDGAWLERDGERVSFGSRRVLRRMLATLADAGFERPGEVLAPDALIAATWPGQRMRADSATTRLHATIARLRKEGLTGLIENVDGGYRLARECQVVDPATDEI